jgi:hypothetical protein
MPTEQDLAAFLACIKICPCFGCALHRKALAQAGGEVGAYRQMIKGLKDMATARPKAN